MKSRRRNLSFFDRTWKNERENRSFSVASKRKIDFLRLFFIFCSHYVFPFFDFISLKKIFCSALFMRAKKIFCSALIALDSSNYDLADVHVAVVDGYRHTVLRAVGSHSCVPRIFDRLESRMDILRVHLHRLPKIFVRSGT